MYPNRQFRFLGSSGFGSECVYNMEVTINNETFEGFGDSKKTAKQAAALKALEKSSSDKSSVTEVPTDFRKKPLCHLKQMYPNREFRFLGSSGLGSECVYTMEVTINNETFEGFGDSKKTAKQAAALKALEKLSSDESSFTKGPADFREKPLCHFKQMYPNREFKFVGTSGLGSECVYNMEVTINNETFEGLGDSKKTAMQAAALKALEKISSNEPPTTAQQTVQPKMPTQASSIKAQSGPLPQVTIKYNDIKTGNEVPAALQQEVPTAVTIDSKELEGNGETQKEVKETAAISALQHVMDDPPKMPPEEQAPQKSTIQSLQELFPGQVIKYSIVGPKQGKLIGARKFTVGATVNGQRFERTRQTHKAAKNSAALFALQHITGDPKANPANPVHRLDELQPNMVKYDVVKKQQNRVCTMEVEVIGMTFKGTGTSMKTAKNAAARIAIEHIMGRETKETETAATEKKQNEENPIVKLQKKYRKNILWKERADPSHAGEHIATLKLGSHTFIGIAQTEKLARQDAARKALEVPMTNLRYNDLGKL